jgi:hypothetical protein
MPSERRGGGEAGLIGDQVDAVVSPLKQLLRPAQPLLVQPAERVGADLLAEVGFAFPFLMSLAGAHWRLSPPALLLVLLGVAVIAAGWLAIADARLR